MDLEARAALDTLSPIVFSGRYGEAMTLLKEALRTHPSNRDILEAPVSFSRTAGDETAAVGYADQLAILQAKKP